MAYNQNRGKRKGNPTNNENQYNHKNKYKKYDNYNNQYNNYYKDESKNAVYEWGKSNYKNDYIQGNYEGISNEDYVSKEAYELYRQENEKLKNENKTMKELKEKLEIENQKLKNNMKEKENKENSYKAEKKENEKLIKNLKTEKKNYESQIKEKEREINNLKLDKEKKLNELKNAKIESNNYLDEINKQKDLINKLEKQKYDLEKSLENEKKKNENYIDIDKMKKEKDEKIVVYESKFEQIYNIISGICCTNKSKTQDEGRNKKISQIEEENNENGEEEKSNNISLQNGNGKVGIVNLELNCYMSSVIQILKNIKEFAEKIFNITNLDDDILLSLKNLIKDLYYSKKNAIQISEFKSNFSKVFTRFEGRQSNDSTFFLIYLFSYLQKILPKSKKNIADISEFYFLNLNSKELEELQKFLLKFETKNNSFIHDLFYHYQMSELICSGCNEIKVSFQGNSVLFLSIYDGKTKLKSLEQCINSYLYTKDKKGDKDFACSSCERRNLSHVMSLVKLPPVLVINLKRVGENGVYSHEVDIPYKLKTKNIEKLKKFNMEYELIGFIKHYGSADDGHNVAYTKNIFDQKWYQFNDSKVELIHGYPDTDKAFILFYQTIH